MTSQRIRALPGGTSVLSAAVLIAAILVTGGIVAAFVVAGGASARGTAGRSADERTPEGAAITALVGAHPADALAHLPADFGARFGYLPQLRQGHPENPAGSCSSPIAMPAQFQPMCREHDFGYDLLRSAAVHGHPLQPWARRALDANLIARMRGSCGDAVCDVAADLADRGVGVNSWREGDTAPGRTVSAPVFAFTVLARLVRS
ncbi:hypothetical protein [Gordonia jinhuaensis]|nr:hypothetical protein [Gordonia jinhuaensis]